MSELQELQELLALLQRHGVRRYKGPVRITHETLLDILLDPQNAAPAVVAPVVEDSTPAQPVEDPEICKCGHTIHAHVNGLCLSACEPEKCGAFDDEQPGQEA